MPLEFRDVQYRQGDLDLKVDLSFMDGIIVGLTGPNGAGQSLLLELAAGLTKPDIGEVRGFASPAAARDSFQSGNPSEVRASIDSALEQNPGLLVIGESFALTDPAYQSKALATFHQLRRNGAIILLASHDLTLLERHCDEVVVLGQGRVIERGDPHQVLRNYRRLVHDSLKRSSSAAKVAPSARHGDQRAEIVALRVLDSGGESTTLVQSGEQVAVQVHLRFRELVSNPVAGILVRSRIGVTVYGTNTELEKVEVGPCAAGEELELSFRFACNLCPGEYTVTVASHDPDGAAHDWLEDAIQFTVNDTRYTAGVANLKARVTLERTAG
jgi:ABC-type Mn2+/Zn2+ transport system ATPase subunit